MQPDQAIFQLTDSEILARLQAGDSALWDSFLTQNRTRFVRMIAVRMDRRLKGRLDASDVIQDAYTEANNRLNDYLKNPTMPPHLWLRFIVDQRLMISTRHHLGVAARNADREQITTGSTADILAAHLVDRATGPEEKVGKQELFTYLRNSLASMEEMDREIIMLRHFEQLSNQEAARELGIEPAAASKRYIRALAKLNEILSARPELLESFR